MTQRQRTQGPGCKRSTEQGTPETQGGSSAQGGGSSQSGLEPEDGGAEGGSERPMGLGENPPHLSVWTLMGTTIMISHLSDRLEHLENI